MTRFIRNRQEEGSRFSRVYSECPEVEAGDRLLESFENQTWSSAYEFEEGYPYPCLRYHILNKQLDWLEADIEKIHIGRYYARQLESLKKPVSAEASAFQSIRNIWNTFDRSFNDIDPPHYDAGDSLNPVLPEAIEAHMFKYSEQTLLHVGKLMTKTAGLFDMSLWLRDGKTPLNSKKAVYILRAAVIDKDQANSKLRAESEEMYSENCLSEIRIKENIAKMHEIVASTDSDDFSAAEIQELIGLSKTTAVDTLYFWQAAINLIEIMLYDEGVTNLPRLRMPRPGLPKAVRPWKSTSAKIYTRHNPGTSRLYP